MKLSRRDLLAAGCVVAGLRSNPIRMAVDPRVTGAMRDGVMFGIDEAARATMLLGRVIEQDSGADIAIRPGAVIDVAGTQYDVKEEPAAYDAVMREARSGGVAGDALTAREWHHSLERYGASELNERFVARMSGPMTSEHWLGWMAVKIIVEASLRASGGETIAATIGRARFDGHKGRALTFASTRHLRQPLYIVDNQKDTVVWPV